jgi:lysophospholipase L1-like esterase
VSSCGKPRYTSYINRKLLEEEFSDLKPDVVVLYMAINDNIYNTFPWLSDLPTVGFFDWADFRTSLLWSFTKYHVIDKKLRSNPEFTNIRSERIFKRNVREIIEIARRRGARVVLSTFAISYPPADAALAERLRTNEPTMEHFWGKLGATVRGVQTHNDVMRRLSAVKHLPLADVADSIPKDSQHFIDLCHLTEAGYAKVVAALVPSIAEVIQASSSDVAS